MKYYCIGIKGTGMSTLAQILYDLGNEVSGYDDAKDYKYTQKGLEERNIPIYYNGSHSLDKNTIVTYSVAFSEDHKELKRVKELGLPIKKYNEIIGEIVDLFETIGVAGTHGKTTTASLIRHILEDSFGCNYFIGAGDGYASKKNKYFVLESDEFNRHFLAYHPKYSIITNIEKEHLEIYKDIHDIRNTFEQFASQTKKEVIACGDNEEVKKITFPKKVLFYGYDNDNNIVIKNEKLEENGSSFDIYIDDNFYNSFTVPLYGKHMILNATAAIAICKELGIPKENIRNSIKTFKNAERRFQIQEIGTTTIIDDYAHHPTEIKVTLQGVRQKYPNKKLIVVFKPNTYSRTKDFAMEFVDALNIADKVFLTEIDCNREKKEDYPGINSNIITDKIPDGEIIDEENPIVLNQYKGEVICFMGCAPVAHLIEKTINILNDNE